MIKFENVHKIYEDNFEAVKNLNFTVKEGELLVLIGPSGCGKTTTMKMINRLIDLSKGTIYINKKPVNDQDPVILRRNIGYVIQQIGLFPHMTIAENIALVPKLKKIDKEVYEKKIDELLMMVGLEPHIYRDRYPVELSGGQQQRIGVIRALAADPSIILMDEPFSALDPISREELQEELVRLKEEINKTIVFVTHDMDEALKIADRICIMKDGEIVQLDTPEKILRYPANDFVKNFIGEKRLNNISEMPELEKVIVKAITIKPEKGLAEAIKILHKYRVDSLVVVDQSKQFLGVVDVWDIYKNYKKEELKICDIIKTNPIILNEKQTINDALNCIGEAKIGYLPVVTATGELKGIITNESLVENIIDEFSI
ncbi:MAG: betaine/proline/choline family ABC transporter ATP-binding protein [Halanaerobiales bacterium]|nr:betaine/proline/choline family ABC transporter ATP-binding protein [Halanaerobiales bacterium]